MTLRSEATSYDCHVICSIHVLCCDRSCHFLSRSNFCSLMTSFFILFFGSSFFVLKELAFWTSLHHLSYFFQSTIFRGSDVQHTGLLRGFKIFFELFEYVPHFLAVSFFFRLLSHLFFRRLPSCATHVLRIFLHHILVRSPSVILHTSSSRTRGLDTMCCMSLKRKI